MNTSSKIHLLILAGVSSVGLGVFANSPAHPPPRPLRTAAPVVGMYYFDGWADRSPANFHVDGMPTNYPDREPLTGWYDDTAAAAHAQVVSARKAGVNFFIFDWYDLRRDKNRSDRTLNSAVNFFRHDRRLHGMQFALLYVNNGAFSIQPDRWDAACQRWVAAYFRHPAYFKINGKPLLVVFSVGDMEKTWGDPKGVAGAWTRLRSAARQARLPGVFVVACATPGPRNGWSDLNRLAQEGYDAYSGYNYPGVPGTVRGRNPYRVLVQGSVAIWDAFAADGRRPYIPVVTDGWDSRPWKETPYWYERTPAELRSFVAQAIRWERAHPDMRVLDRRPLIFVEAWNELGEGSYVVPTRGDQGTYARALRQALREAGGLAARPIRPRSPNR
jgi:Glycosyltransferase WbsX